MVILPSRWSACSTPIVKLAHRSARAVTVGVIVALSITLVSGNAIAATAIPSSTPAGISTTAPRHDADDAFDELERRLKAVPANATAEEAARIIYPNDPAGQAEYIDLAHKVDEAANSSIKPQDRVVPVVLARFIPILVQCVKGAAAGVVGAEAGSVIVSGSHTNVKGVVEGAVGGCITSSVPPGALRNMANAAKPQIVAAITAIIIRMSRP